eukprot:1150130-Pelagomonas_calceolata.AAC.7
MSAGDSNFDACSQHLLPVIRLEHMLLFLANWHDKPVLINMFKGAPHFPRCPYTNEHQAHASLCALLHPTAR